MLDPEPTADDPRAEPQVVTGVGRGQSSKPHFAAAFINRRFGFLVIPLRLVLRDIRHRRESGIQFVYCHQQISWRRLSGKH